MKKIAVITGASIFSLGLVSAATAAEITSSVSAHVLVPITITEITTMDFGTITLSSQGITTISLDTNGSVSGTNATSSGSPAAAVFNITGSPDEALDITIATNTTPVTTGSDTITLDTFVHDAGATPTTDSSGLLTLSVGASLTTAATQAGGTYEGDYTMTVNYN
jgi:hypothetical protein